MTSLLARASFLLTGAVLLVVLAVLTVDRVNYCGQPSNSIPSRGLTNVRTPTLAPTQKVVFLQVESDSADLEVSLVGN